MVISGESSTIDQKKRKRMESNRESARRSRLRKRRQLDDLTVLAARLQCENMQLEVHVKVVMEQWCRVEQENMVVRGELEGLRQRLRRANSVLRIYEEFSGEEMEVKEEEPTVRQWFLPQEMLGHIY